MREKVYVSGTANNLYRKRPGSLTEAANDEQHYYMVRRFFLDWATAYLQRHGIKNIEIENMIERARSIPGL
ncbi:MAG: hypothetical protein WKI04_08950 [Ferruginibacter sp.]